eukprot:5223919-Amphidinium_carterae.3
MPIRNPAPNAIIDQLFTKVKLNEKQDGHRLSVNNKAMNEPPVTQPPEDNEHRVTVRVPVEAMNMSNQTNTLPLPPGLDIHTPRLYVHPTSKAMARPNAHKPTHQLMGMQPPPNLAHLDDIDIKKDLTLEHTEDKEEKPNGVPHGQC